MGAEKKTEVLPCSPNAKRYISLDEVKKHNQPDDRWLLIENKVYNITNWAKKHPGGGKILGHFSGQDATVNFISISVVIILQQVQYYTNKYITIN